MPCIPIETSNISSGLTSKRNRAFEVTSKRRRGFPSETQVKRGNRVVHGDKELIRKARTQRPVSVRINQAVQVMLHADGVLLTGPGATTTHADEPPFRFGLQVFPDSGHWSVF
jgi:hypothetical protein